MLFSLVLSKTSCMAASCSSSVDPVTKISSSMTVLIPENTICSFCWNMSWDIIKLNGKRLNLYLQNGMFKVHSRLD